LTETCQISLLVKNSFQSAYLRQSQTGRLKDGDKGKYRETEYRLRAENKKSSDSPKSELFDSSKLHT
jgi:hypothetical protein